jgi:iron transport multicopper oxidase
MSFSYLSPENAEGLEPVPLGTLMNDAQNIQFNLTPGKTYLIRVISMAAFAAHFVQFDGHKMTIIAIDGVYLEKQETDSIYLTAAQRYDVLITAKSTREKNFGFVSSIDLSMFDPSVIPPNIKPNCYGTLVYDHQKPHGLQPNLAPFSPIDDINLVPYDRQPLLGPVDRTIKLTMEFTTDSNGINRWA